MKIGTKLNISHETLTHGNHTNLTRGSDNGLSCVTDIVTWITFLKLKKLRKSQNDM